MSAAHTPGPMKTSDVLWFALIALGKEGGNMEGGKYRTEWVMVRDAVERAKKSEREIAAAPMLAEALRELENAAGDLLAAMPGSVDFDVSEKIVKRKSEKARAALTAAGIE